MQPASCRFVTQRFYYNVLHHALKLLPLNAALGGNGSIERQELERTMENIIIEELSDKGGKFPC